MNKQHWLSIAEVIDALRVMPRVIWLASFIGLVAYIGWVTDWYMNLDEPSAWDMTFISSTISVLSGIVGGMATSYWKTGRKWNDAGG